MSDNASALANLMDDPQLVEMNGQYYIAKYFQYVLNVAALANATTPGQIQIDSDADFQLLYLIGSYDAATLTYAVTEGGAGGLAWSSAPVNAANFMGTSQLPFPVGLIPQLLPKKRVYSIAVTNSTGGTLNTQICFTGYKLYGAALASQVGAQPSSS